MFWNITEIMHIALYIYEPTSPRIIFWDNLAETRASTVMEGTKITSGSALINLSWGTLSPALLAAIAAGGVTSPVMRVKSSNLLIFTLFIMNSIIISFLLDSSALSQASKHTYFCYFLVSTSAYVRKKETEIRDYLNFLL